MAKKSSGYFGFDFLISLILAIIPFTNIVFGVIIRAQAGNLLGVILNIVLCPAFYFIDLISIILKKKIFVLV